MDFARSRLILCCCVTRASAPSLVDFWCWCVFYYFWVFDHCATHVKREIRFCSIREFLSPKNYAIISRIGNRFSSHSNNRLLNIDSVVTATLVFKLHLDTSFFTKSLSLAELWLLGPVSWDEPYSAYVEFGSWRTILFDFPIALCVQEHS